MEVIAHRGGLWPGYAENTLAAFQQSAALGLRWIETDVHASADGVLYAVHDPDLQRLAGIPHALEQLPAHTLDGIELRSGGHLPRLEEVIAAMPQVALNIDVKADSAVAPMIRARRGYAKNAQLRLASFSTRRLTQLRQALPDVPTSAGTAEVALLKFTAFRAASTLHPRIDSLQVPHQWAGLPVVTRRFMRAAHRHGLQVHVWTINDPRAVLQLAELGVDGVVTDFPARALAALNAAGD